MKMKTSELIFVGIKGSVLALNAATGEQIWVKVLKGRDFVSVVAQEDKIFASVQGEVFCLEAQTGRELWHNPLRGYGVGLTSVATTQGLSSAPIPSLAEKHRIDAQDAATGASAAT
jgi:outer membrane protein assembly factor BamB